MKQKRKVRRRFKVVRRDARWWDVFIEVPGKDECLWFESEGYGTVDEAVAGFLEFVRSVEKEGSPTPHPIPHSGARVWDRGGQS